jgi:hypothetical protein
MTFVNAIVASQYEADLVYAVFNNHKNGDFKPYIFKSSDKGKSWKSISGNLPLRGTVYDIAEDHVDKNLLFAGTEFGCFFSKDGGQNWHQLKSGLPTIAIKDIEIQRRENDLVLASFGRGFYILDDYSPLRNFKEEDQKNSLTIYPIKDAWMFIESTPLGLSGKANQGESYYGAENPAVAAVITYLFNDTTLISIKDQRKKKESELVKNGKDVPYPTLDALHKEDWENNPYLIATISDAQGEVVRRLRIDKPQKGFNRLNWDFRYEALVPVQLQNKSAGRYESTTNGALAAPGTYYVQFHKFQAGKLSELTAKTAFIIKALNNVSLAASDKKQLNDFSVKMAKMRRAARGASEVYSLQVNRLKHVQKAIHETTDSDLKLLEKISELGIKQKEMAIVLYGDASLSSREFAFSPGLLSRIESTMDNFWSATSAVPSSANRHYNESADIFESMLKELRLMNDEITKLEEALFKLGAPYTQGSNFIPDWKRE